MPSPNEHSCIQLPVSQISAYAANPREHPPAQIEMLKKGIRRFGFNVPVLVTPQFELIAGHGRIQAARALNMTSVPAIVLSHLTPDEQRAYRIADNATSLKSRWSLDLLRAEVSFIMESSLDLDAMDLGFETGDLDFYLDGDAKAKDAAVGAGPPPDRSLRPVSKLGDIWSIADQLILCGDSTSEASYSSLMGEDRADAVISDMPWNRKIDGHVGGLGKIKHPEFAMASGEMTRDSFGSFTRTVLGHQARFSREGALNFQFIDWRGVSDMISIGEDIYDELINLCVWAKQQGSMGSLYRSQHELVCVFRVKGARHDNFVNLGKHGRSRTNVWQYPAPSGFGPDRANLKLHPTCKNVDMIADAIKDCTRRKGIVLDAFLGSGTTLLAAYGAGRRGRGIEIDPYYVDVAVRRLQTETGAVATLSDGTSFTDAMNNAHKKDMTND